MRADSGVKTVKDLIGKTIAVTPGEAGLPLLQAIWAAKDIAPDAGRLLNVDGSAKLLAVLNKRVDGLPAGLDSQVVILNRGLFTDQLKAASTLFYAPGDTQKRLGFMMEEDWARTDDLMKRYRGLTTDMPTNAFFTDEFIKKYGQGSALDPLKAEP